jgi:hypothetical protein
MGRYNTQEDFWNKVNKETATGCWEWTGSKDRDGYGLFKMNKQNILLAHRWSVVFDNREISNKVVMHKCDNPACVNPAHLSLGTQADNVQDMHAKSRYVKPTSKLSDDDIKDIKTSSLTGVELAKKYNISGCYVSNIRNKGKR